MVEPGIYPEAKMKPAEQTSLFEIVAELKRSEMKKCESSDPQRTFQ